MCLRLEFNVKLFSLNGIEIARCSCHMSCDLLVAGSYQPSLTQVPAPRWVSCKELHVVVLRCPLHDIKVWGRIVGPILFWIQPTLAVWNGTCNSSKITFKLYYKWNKLMWKTQCWCCLMMVGKNTKTTATTTTRRRSALWGFKYILAYQLFMGNDDS